MITHKITDLNIEKIRAITLPSWDNGVEFTNSTRVNYIVKELKSSHYNYAHMGKLAHIFTHHDFNPNAKAVLISTHIDAVHKEFFAEESGENFLGCFDNAITNAVVLNLMLQNQLSPQVIIAFTGDEEQNSRGADETVAFCQKKGYQIGCVIVTDVTFDGWEEDYKFTIENIFPAANHQNFAQTCRELLGDIKVVSDAWQDESWQYDENNLSCFSLCLPCNGEMHGEQGVLVRKNSLTPYAKAMVVLSDKLTQYIA